LDATCVTQIFHSKQGCWDYENWLLIELIGVGGGEDVELLREFLQSTAAIKGRSSQLMRWASGRSRAVDEADRRGRLKR
jgi:hypothetical protein